MDHNEFMKQLKELLVEHGITDFGSCGCCEGTWVNYYSEEESLCSLSFSEGTLSATLVVYDDDDQTETPVSV